MKKKFNNLLSEFGAKYSRFTVWNDFISMVALSIANAFDFIKEREDEYMSIAKKYNAVELDRFANMLAVLVVALEKNSEQDFLGELYMEHGLGNTRNGQYFTPYHIADMMSRIVIGNDDAQGKAYKTVNDPTCGSGVMLIAAFNDCKKKGVNPHNNMFIVAQDIDSLIAKMCYIQLSLLGAAGYVVIRNTLTQPLEGNPLFAPDDAWCTPMYFNGIWTSRRFLLNIGAKQSIAG